LELFWRGDANQQDVVAGQFKGLVVAKLDGFACP
jgi:hypothetical protein